MTTIITGDECGLLKQCTPPQSATNKVVIDKGIAQINPNQHADRRRGIVALAWTCPNDEQFASLHMDGVVEIWEPQEGIYQRSKQISDVFKNDKIDPLSRPLSMASLAADDSSLCACNAQGRIVLLRPHQPEPVVSSFDTLTCENNSSSSPLVSAMAVDTGNSRVAVGGKDRETVLWDIKTAKPVWKAKNLPPDPQTLLQPLVWPTAIQFLPDNLLAVGTAHKQVRLYDTRVQKRPVAVTPDDWIQHRVTALCGMENGDLAVGDATGTILTMDVRQLLRSKNAAIKTPGRLVGPGGSVRQMVACPQGLAAVGLDRMLRVYAQQKQVACVYLKQRLNCLLVGQQQEQEHDTTNVSDAEDHDIDQEDDVNDYVDSSDDNSSSSGSDSGSLDESDHDEPPFHTKKKRRHK